MHLFYHYIFFKFFSFFNFKGDRTDKRHQNLTSSKKFFSLNTFNNIKKLFSHEFATPFFNTIFDIKNIIIILCDVFFLNFLDTIEVFLFFNNCFEEGFWNWPIHRTWCFWVLQLLDVKHKLFIDFIVI